MKLNISTEFSTNIYFFFKLSKNKFMICIRSLHKYMTLNDDLPKYPITFYVRLSNLHTMKLDGKTLSNILHQYVMPTETDQKVKLL